MRLDHLQILDRIGGARHAGLAVSDVIDHEEEVRGYCRCVEDAEEHAEAGNNGEGRQDREDQCGHQAGGGDHPSEQVSDLICPGLDGHRRAADRTIAMGAAIECAGSHRDVADAVAALPLTAPRALPLHLHARMPLAVHASTLHRSAGPAKGPMWAPAHPTAPVTSAAAGCRRVLAVARTARATGQGPASQQSPSPGTAPAPTRVEPQPPKRPARPALFEDGARDPSARSRSSRPARGAMSRSRWRPTGARRPG